MSEAMASHEIKYANMKKFQLKLIEILGDGFDRKQNHDYVADIQLSRTAYKLQDTDIEYVIIKALLNLSALINAHSIYLTVQEILVFFENVIDTHIVSCFSKLECLRAIQDCCLKCEHLKEYDVCGTILKFFNNKNIMNKDCVLDFYDRLKPTTHGHILEQHSSKLLISKLRGETPNYEVHSRDELYSRGRPSTSDKEDDDDIPMIFLIRRNLERSRTFEPVHIWMRDNIQNQNNEPVVENNGEASGLQKEDVEKPETVNKPLQEEEDSEYEYDDDETDFGESVDDENSSSAADKPLKYLTKNFWKTQKIRQSNNKKNNKKKAVRLLHVKKYRTRNS